MSRYRHVAGKTVDRQRPQENATNGGNKLPADLIRAETQVLGDEYRRGSDILEEARDIEGLRAGLEVE